MKVKVDEDVAIAKLNLESSYKVKGGGYMLLVDCPHCRASHWHSWGGQRTCSSCRQQYEIVDIPTREISSAYAEEAGGMGGAKSSNP